MKNKLFEQVVTGEENGTIVQESLFELTAEQKEQLEFDAWMERNRNVPISEAVNDVTETVTPKVIQEAMRIVAEYKRTGILNPADFLHQPSKGLVKCMQEMDLSDPQPELATYHGFVDDPAELHVMKLLAEAAGETDDGEVVTENYTHDNPVNWIKTREYKMWSGYQKEPFWKIDNVGTRVTVNRRRSPYYYLLTDNSDMARVYAFAGNGTQDEFSGRPKSERCFLAAQMVREFPGTNIGEWSHDSGKGLVSTESQGTRIEIH